MGAGRDVGIGHLANFGQRTAWRKGYVRRGHAECGCAFAAGIVCLKMYHP